MTWLDLVVAVTTALLVWFFRELERRRYGQKTCLERGALSPPVSGGARRPLDVSLNM